MVGDHRVYGEAALLRRKAVVAPLGCQNSNQLFVPRQFAEDVGGGAICPAKKRSSEEPSDAVCDGTGNGFLRRYGSIAFSRLDRRDITVDSGRVLRKIGLQAGGETVLGRSRS